MYYSKYNMRTQIMPASELRSNLARVLSRIRDEEAPCFITKSGKAVAALLPISLYDELISSLEDRLDEQDAALGEQVREARREYKAGKTVPLAKLKGLLGR